MGSRVHEPSKLHLRRELTQIRKAAKVLRDPGTTSSWKSPLSSSRSVTPSFLSRSYDSIHHCPFRPNYDDARLTARNDDDIVNNNINNHVGDFSRNNKERRVFLYNWRSNNKSSSEKSLGRFDLDGSGNGNVDGGNEGEVNLNEGSSLRVSVVSASGEDSWSDGRKAGGDSKSDTCIGESYRRGSSQGRRYSAGLRCRDTRLVNMASPVLARKSIGKKKTRRGAVSSTSVTVKKHLQKQMKSRRVADRTLRRGSGSFVLSQDDSASLMDQSDTSSLCFSEELHGVSAESPLLSRLRHKHRFLRGSQRDDSSYNGSTPALSTGSFSRFALANCRNPSTVGSWDGTTTSLNEGADDEEDPIDLPGRQGCGIRYWSKRTSSHKGSSGSGYSPSLSDTLRRTGGRLLCVSQKHYHKRRRSVSRTKEKILSQIAKGQLPLLANSCDGGDSSLATGNSDDELTTNFGELNLESLSRFDGRRWSSRYKSQEGMDLMPVGTEGEEENSPENIRSLSQRYRPIFFDELIGQHIVVQSLMNSILRGRVAPVYLFQGPRGTGKTSMAKIFAATLNCLVAEGIKPCGICRECTEFISGKSKDLLEVDGSNKKAIDRVRYVLKSLSITPPSSRFKVLLIDECHLLPSKAWLAFLKFLEEPPPRVVFLFVTTDLDNVPRTILSRCQIYTFNKIKDSDIATRLKNIAAKENLDVDSDALNLIALNADGSLRDAETMLDQLSLLGKRITTTLVNDLVGIISDDKLLELLDLAMSSNTAETVKRARDLMDSGVDPLVLMSQLASLIMDIIAGSNQLADAKCSSSSFGGRSLSEMELEKLKHALKLLSESEKQLRVSSERSTWFTATLLQLGSVTSPEFTLSGSSKKKSSETTEDDPSTASRDPSGYNKTSNMRTSASPPSFSAGRNKSSIYPEEPYLLTGGGNAESKVTHKCSVNSVDSTASHGDFVSGSINMAKSNMDALDDIWLHCIDGCHSKTLRQLLHSHGKLLSIAEADGVLVVYIAFGNEDVKSRAERFLISITNSIETVLRRSAEVRLILLPGTMIKSGNLEPMGSNLSVDVPVHLDDRDGYADPDSHQELVNVSRGNSNDPKGKLNGRSNSSMLWDERSSSILAQSSDNTSNVRRLEIPMQRIESIIREQRLESAWLQAAERSTPRSLSRLRPEKNQVLPQDGMYCQDQIESTIPVNSSPIHWDDELNHEIKALKVNDGKALQKDQTAIRNDHLPISPSLLHQSGFVANLSKEHQGYESGPGKFGCNMLFCWNSGHLRKGKIDEDTLARPRKGGRFLCFGDRRKSRHNRAAR